MTVSPSNVQNICGKPAHSDTQVEIKKFTVVREVLRNNYRSHGLIGPYNFWGMSPRNSTSFTRPFLAGRRARTGHETREAPLYVVVNHVIRPLVQVLHKLRCHDALGAGTRLLLPTRLQCRVCHRGYLPQEWTP